MCGSGRQVQTASHRRHCRVSCPTITVNVIAWRLSKLWKLLSPWFCAHSAARAPCRKGVHTGWCRQMKLRLNFSSAPEPARRFPTRRLTLSTGLSRPAHKICGPQTNSLLRITGLVSSVSCVGLTNVQSTRALPSLSSCVRSGYFHLLQQSSFECAGNQRTGVLVWVLRRVPRIASLGQRGLPGRPGAYSSAIARHRLRSAPPRAGWRHAGAADRRTIPLPQRLPDRR